MVMTMREWMCCLTIGLTAPACAVGYGIDTTVARTAPWHDHQDVIVGAEDVGDAPLARMDLKARWGTFLRYYPVPVGFQVGTVQGPARSWGNATLTAWTEIGLKMPAEEALRILLEAATVPESSVTVHGVVTAFSWYVLPDARGGRITSRLVAVDGKGDVVWQGERTTLARARTPDALLRAHVAAWLNDGALRAALK